MDIKEFRQKYPMYNDLSDVEVADRLHTQSYADIPKAEFYKRFGVSVPGTEFSAMRMLRNVPGSARQAFQDLVDPLVHPVETAKALGNLGLGVIQKALPGYQEQEQYADAVGKFIKDRYGSVDAFKETAMTDPIGLMFDAAGVLTGVGGAARAGTKAGSVANKAARVVQKAGAAVDPVNLAVNTVKATVGKPLAKLADPVAMYESAAKFGTTIPQATRARMAETALKYGLMPTQSGVDKLDNLIAGMNAQIDTLIDSATGTVPKDNLYRYIQEVKDRLGGVKVEGADDIKKVNAYVKRLDDHLWNINKDALTAEELQWLKVDAYKRIKFEPGKPAAPVAKQETYKAIARAAKEDIETLAPEVGPINRQLGPLYELQNPPGTGNGLPQAASRIQNRNLFSINAPLNIGAGGVVGGGSGDIGGAAAGAIAGAGMAAIDNPRVKTRAAIGIYNLQNSPLYRLYLDNALTPEAIRQVMLQSGRLYDEEAQ